MKKLNIININTTAFQEEDFLLLTDLKQDEIMDVIQPIVLLERNEIVTYSNDDLMTALETTYPNNYIEFYTYESLDEISI
jgi:hypothetical protein